MLTNEQKLARLGNLNPEIALMPFARVIGDDAYPKIVNDVKAQLGRWAKDMKTEAGDWTVTSGYKLKSKDGHELQMPLNNPAAILLRFGMQLCKLEKDGNFSVDATLPKSCQNWVDEHKKSKSAKAEPVTT